MFKHKDAILRLLRDDDTQTVELVKCQLASQGRDAMPDLVDLLSADDATVARHVREIIGQIDSQLARRELSELCAHFPADDGYEALERAAFLLARALAPGCDTEAAKKRLDEWGAALAETTPKARTPAGRVKLIADFFGRQIGFRGNVDDYYNPANSLLPQVILSKQGIPITLALVYIFSAKRAGIPLEGISFPGHFLVRHGEVIFDPFERGHALDLKDCAEILARQNLQMEPVYFATASGRTILRRMFTNLFNIYETGEDELAAVVAGWLNALEG